MRSIDPADSKNAQFCHVSTANRVTPIMHECCVGACLRHTHTWVFMHSYCWSYGTISIATAGPVCRFSYGDQLPSRYSIRDVVQYLVLYWVCSDGLCACVCSVSLRGFRAVCVTVSADQDSGCEPRQQVAVWLCRPTARGHFMRASVCGSASRLRRNLRFNLSLLSMVHVPPGRTAGRLQDASERPYSVLGHTVANGSIHTKVNYPVHIDIQ